MNIISPKNDFVRLSKRHGTEDEGDSSHSPRKILKRVSVGGESCRGMSNPFARHQQEIGAENKKKILANLVRPEPILKKTAIVDDQTKPSISNRAAPLFPTRKISDLSPNSKMAENSPWAQFKKEVNKTNPSSP